jgi:hypothetical protein
LTQNSSKDRVTVASEKADFIADRIAAGVPAPEQEIRKLARDLREIASQMGPAWKKPRPSPAIGVPPVGATPVGATPVGATPAVDPAKPQVDPKQPLALPAFSRHRRTA